MRITDLREKIDGLDSQILQLLNERARIALLLAAAKVESDLPIVNMDREAVVINRIVSLNEGPLAAEDMRMIFTSIVEACRNLQLNRIQK